MRAGVRAALGAALVVVAIVGQFAIVRAFDRARVADDVPARAWTQDGAYKALPLGRYLVPARGQLRVVICPVPLVDPHATLEVSISGGRSPQRMKLEPDEARGKRCFDAHYDSRRETSLRARLTIAATATPPHANSVELQTTRRITWREAWPVVLLLVGLALLVVGSPAHAPVPPTTSDGPSALPLPYDPAQWPGGVIPDDAIVPDASVPTVAQVVAPVPRGDTGTLATSRFGWLLAIGALVAIHLALAVFSAAYYVIAGPTRTFSSGLFFAVSALVQNTLFVLFAALLLGAFTARSGRAALGFIAVRPIEALRAVLIALGLVALAGITTHFIKDVSESPIGRMVEIVPVRYALGFAALMAPVSEELFFRGVLIPAFGRRSIVFGVIVSVVVFTGAHAMQLTGALVGLIPIAAVAITNALLRVKTGGITQSWIVHTVYNGLLSLGLYFG